MAEQTELTAGQKRARGHISVDDHYQAYLESLSANNPDPLDEPALLRLAAESAASGAQHLTDLSHYLSHLASLKEEHINSP